MKKPIQIQIEGTRTKGLASPFTRSTSTLLLITLALACFPLSPAARAVLPAPGGGYPDENTAVGGDALFSLTTGVYNTAIGFNALYSNTTGQVNTAIGGGVLITNTTGSGNTAVGGGALYYNTIGGYNTAVGNGALAGNDRASSNTAVGSEALSNNLTGNLNIALGAGAGNSNIGGNNNIYIGNHGVWWDESNTIRIGGDAGIGYGPQTATFIAGITGVSVINGDPVVIDANDQLGTIPLANLQGPPGVAGPAGATGAMGPAGPQGQAGATGAIGPAGPQGPAGAVGATGAAGATGAVGPQGPQGPAGDASVSGAFITLAANATPPPGFTLMGTTTVTYRDTQNVIHDSTARLYRKN